MERIEKMGRKSNLSKKTLLLWSCIAFFLLAAGITTAQLIKNGMGQKNSMEQATWNGAISPLAPETPDTPMQKILDPDSEVRGVWIATVNNIDFPSKPGLSAVELRAELDDIVKNVKAANLNAIYFQVRPSADALYQSDYFPTSAYLTGTQGATFADGFDPFAYLIEKAHNENVTVHAWVNPLRVTYSSKDVLAKNHPAVVNPALVIKYADNRLYFDAGLPEVRTLIANGVAEIVSRYDVDGVVFDDYFYPYPTTVEQADGTKTVAPYEDNATFQKYGVQFKDKGDWRRNNINQIVEACYKAIKNINTECKFGIAPFGIWQNASGSNGGSDTAGLNSYSEIYCDALAWIKGGYIDYIAPQIYWQFSTKVARYDVLVRWWNQQLDAYSNVDLYVSHAAYRSSEWGTVNEIRNQVEYARSERSYKGSIFYGYAAIKKNDLDVRNQLVDCYDKEIIYTKIVSNEKEVEFRSPINGGYVGDVSSTYVIGSSDPAYPLTMDGVAVSRTKQGYFSLYVPLKDGKNTFLFEHKGTKTEYCINKGFRPSTGNGSYATMDAFEFQNLVPSSDYMVAGGQEITVKATAPAGSTVTAALNGSTITLKPQIFPPKDSKYKKEVYVGKFVLPNSPTDGKILDLGKISYQAVLEGKTQTAMGARVRLAGKNAQIPIEVIKNDSEFKIALDSWYYDDFTPATCGMRDYAVWQGNGYYKLRVGGYVADKDAKELPDTAIPIAQVSGASMKVTPATTQLFIKVNQNVPVSQISTDNTKEFVFTLYNVDATTAKDIAVATENPLFSAIRWEKTAKENSYRYVCTLYDADNFYGFTFSYQEGNLVVSFRNPQKLPDTATPLTGKTIILDAGHGGNDQGATGPGAWNEEDLNLAITLAASEKLKALGANVLLTRDAKKTVDITWRMDYYEQVNPDLAISIHQNSMTYDADITRIRGLIGLYYAEAGKLLTKSVSASVSNALNRFERTPTQQRLAMVRNPKFPSTLVEVCFITCVEEYDLMMRADTVQTTAQAIAQGVLDYYATQSKFVK